MLRQFLLTLIAFTFYATGCKKKDVDGPEPPAPPPPGPNNPPAAFTISLETASWDTAKVKWIPAIDPENDTVLYRVYINDTLKAENLTALTYTFRNLTELTTYNVKVVAVDTRQNQVTSLFSFITKKYWLKFLQKVEYGPITGYSLQKTGQMVKGNDGGYIIVGDTQSGDWPYGAIKTFAMKVDSLGHKVWQKIYDHHSGNSQHIRIVNYNAGYIICGGDNLARISNTGDLTWRQSVTGMQEVVNGIAVSSDGSIYTAGNEFNQTSGKVQAVLRKYDAAGTLQWKKTFSFSAREELYEIKIYNNDILVFGITREPDADSWVMKLNLDGDILWNKDFPDPSGYAFPENLIKTSEGNYVLTGFSTVSSSGSSLYLHMIDASGNTMWKYTPIANQTRGYSVSETADNALVVTGGFLLNYYSRSALYKFDKSGNMIWEKLYEEFPVYLFNKTVIPTSDGGFFINCQKSKAYNAAGETDQIYIFKTDDKGEFN